MLKLAEFLPITGGTTIGLVFKEGVILISEKRFSLGHYVMSRSAKKVFKVAPHVGAACVGLVSDMQTLIYESQAHANLFRLDSNRPIPVRSAAKLVSNLLFRMRLMPFLTQTIIGGVDGDEAAVYALDPLGSVIKDKYVAIGSGAEMAAGVLEEGYREDMTEEEAKEL
ncbi:TPA: proteasome subunit beta, partial [Candidatus Bathyarchaeota archaeon]|nr:proteasome subunit beta [Candidatus Bathyarchaeota archaeon]